MSMKDVFRSDTYFLVPLSSGEETKSLVLHFTEGICEVSVTFSILDDLPLIYHFRNGSLGRVFLGIW